MEVQSMEEAPPTNELIERLVGRLSPAGRDALARLDAREAAPLPGIEPDVDEALAIMEALELTDALSAEDRGTIVRILELRSRAHEGYGERLDG